MNHLGRLYHALGKDEEAGPLLERALQLCQKAVGSHHPQYARCLVDLGLHALACGTAQDVSTRMHNASVATRLAHGPRSPEHLSCLRYKTFAETRSSLAWELRVRAEGLKVHTPAQLVELRAGPSRQ